MSSILTNNAAMVALQTLKSVNSQLGGIQNQISTGLEVSQAKDNAAVFSIAQVMRSDVSGFKAVSDSLSLGASTVSVASKATDSIADTLNEIKTKIVSANESNVDRDKLDAEINSLVEQIEGVTSAAQFNGLNLIDGSQAGNLDILSSLDRDGAGNVTANQITVDLSGTNLSTDAGAVAGGAYAGTTGVSAAEDKFAQTIDAAGTADVTFAAATAGDVFTLTVGDETFEYTAQANDDFEAAAYAIRDQINAAGITGVTATADDSGVLTVANAGANDIAMTGEAVTTGAGGLAELANINVTTAAGAAAALTEIETMIGTVIDAQATFGTAEKRIETQGEFLSKLTDSFTSGIGSLVDADLEQASARLQALQVQQQLGTQALSIANQAPQQLLSLFR